MNVVINGIEYHNHDGIFLDPIDDEIIVNMTRWLNSHGLLDRCVITHDCGHGHTILAISLTEDVIEINRFVRLCSKFAMKYTDGVFDVWYNGSVIRQIAPSGEISFGWIEENVAYYGIEFSRLSIGIYTPNSDYVTRDIDDFVAGLFNKVVLVHKVKDGYSIVAICNLRDIESKNWLRFMTNICDKVSGTEMFEIYET